MAYQNTVDRELIEARMASTEALFAVDSVGAFEVYRCRTAGETFDDSFTAKVPSRIVSFAVSQYGITDDSGGGDQRGAL